MSAILTSSVTEHRDSRLVRDTRTALMVWRRDLIRLRRNYVRIVFGIAQPLGFLIVFSVGLATVIGDDALPGDASYRVFIFPGILAMSIISSALISCVSIVWDREFGFMREMLVAPVSRSALILGKTLGGGSIAMSQGLILLVLAPFVGVDLTVARVVALLAALILMAFSITALGIVLASSVDRIQTLQTLVTLVVQPIIFTSGALVPGQQSAHLARCRLPVESGDLRRRPRPARAPRPSVRVDDRELGRADLVRSPRDDRVRNRDARDCYLARGSDRVARRW